MSRSNRSSSSAGDSTQSNGVRHRTGATRKSGTFQPPALPKWVPDAEQSSCMLCSRKFGLVSRRHHCRNCGILVCQTCSNHMIPLLQSGTTPVRVCDRCYETLSMTDTETRTIMPAIKGETTVVRRSQSFADPRFGRPSLPTWTYAFTSCAPDDAPVSIGRLTIRIRGSTALPPVDYFGTADPYVVVTLGTQSVRTKIQPKTLTPTWNEEFVLDVTNATASVKMEIWDSDQLGFDRLMGYTTISLPDLSHQLRVAKSLPITWSENEGVTHVKTTAHLNVELHYTYSTIGAFISQFHPIKDQQHDIMDYDTDLLYTQGVRLWTLCQPILIAITAITSLLNWSHPLFSAIVFVLYLYVALHPWIAAVLIHLALIRYLIWQYVYRVWERGTEKERIRSESLAVLDKNVNGVEGKVSSVPPLAPVFVGTVNEATHIAGMTEELTQLQHMITHLCTLLESISNLFTWKHPSHTRTFLIFLLFSLAYCCFLPQQYLLLILGVYVLTQQTAPIQTITWIWDGLHRWITRKRIDPKTVPASERVTIPIGPRLVGTARITERLMAEFE